MLRLYNQTRNQLPASEVRYVLKSGFHSQHQALVVHRRQDPNQGVHGIFPDYNNLFLIDKTEEGDHSIRNTTDATWK